MYSVIILEAFLKPSNDMWISLLSVQLDTDNLLPTGRLFLVPTSNYHQLVTLTIISTSSADRWHFERGPNGKNTSVFQIDNNDWNNRATAAAVATEHR